MYVTQQIIFNVGKEEYGMDVQWVNGIESLAAIVPVPNAPKFILGIINLRGEVLPVYSLRVKFGLPEEENNEETKVIITRCNGVDIAFKVDRVVEILELEDSEVIAAPKLICGELTSYLKRIANHAGRLIILLDQNGLLSQEETKSIEALKSE